MIDEARSRLQALNRVSEAVNGSVTSTDVIDSAVSTTLTATGLSCGVFYWFDRENDCLVGRADRGFQYGLTPGIDVHSKRSHSLPSRAYRASEPLVFDVDGRRSGYRAVTERERRCIVPEGIRTAAFLKIGTGKSSHGVLALCTHRPSSHFNEDWLELFSMVSEQVGAALDRAQSHDAIAQRAADLDILHELARRLDVEDDGLALSDALDYARRSFGFERCVVDGGTLAPTIEADNTPSAVVPNEIVMPLVVGSQGLGRLRIACEKPPDARDRGVATAIANLMAVAAWRDWRYRERNRANSAELRKTLARDIHDGVAQRFYAIQLNLMSAAAAVEEPGGNRQFLDQALRNSQLGVEESRQWVRRLRQPKLRHGRFRDELAASVDDFTADFGVACELSIRGDEAVLEPSTHQAVASAVHELLHNVGKHAAAATAQLDARFAHDRLEIAVVDDGRGAGIGSAVAEGFGLCGVRERMAEVGGSVSVSGRPTGGTVATLSVPLPSER